MYDEYIENWYYIFLEYLPTLHLPLNKVLTLTPLISFQNRGVQVSEQIFRCSNFRESLIYLSLSQWHLQTRMRLVFRSSGIQIPTKYGCAEREMVLTTIFIFQTARGSKKETLDHLIVDTIHIKLKQYSSHIYTQRYTKLLTQYKVSSQ